MSNDNPTNEQELREQFVDAMWNYFGIEDKSELDHFRTIFDEVVNPLITAHTNAEITKKIKLIKNALVGFTGDNDFVIVAIDRRIAELQAERAKLKEVK